MDPSKKPSDRADHLNEAAKSAQKQGEHACKADCNAHDAKRST
jgi:hypothetical protein